MKKMIQAAAWTALLTLAFGCATLLPEPRLEDLSRANATWPHLQLSDLKQGRKLYVENCAACHELHAPSERESAQWERIMMKMQRKAKIDDATKDNIMQYLLTFAKTSP